MGKSSVHRVGKTCSPEIQAIFWSRFEEKIDQMLDSFGEDFMSAEDPETLRQSYKLQWGKTCRQITQLSQVCAKAHHLNFKIYISLTKCMFFSVFIAGLRYRFCSTGIVFPKSHSPEGTNDCSGQDSCKRSEVFGKPN